ncbi:MAG: ATP-binding protein [Polyangiaceae bacterium]
MDKERRALREHERILNASSHAFDGSGAKPAPVATPVVRPAHAALQAMLAAVEARPGELDSVLGSSPEALIAFDENRHILHANRGAEELFGYGPGALNGASTDILLPARLRQPEAPPMVPLADVMQVDLPGLRQDGTELSVEWVLGSVPMNFGAVYVMTVRDHSVVERAMEALRASEERFRLLVDGVHDYAIFMLDPNGAVSSWNKGAERSLGFGVEEILGQSYEVFFVAEDRAAGVPRQLLDAAIRNGNLDVTGWRVRKDGTRFQSSSYLTALRSPQGELRGIAKITRDLTAKLQAEELERRLSAERAGREAAEAAEQRVRESEERLRRLQRVTAALSEAITPLEVASVILDQGLQPLEASGGAVYQISADRDALEIVDQRGHPAQPLAEFKTIPLDLRSPLTDAARGRRPGFYESNQQCVDLYPHLRDAIASGDFEASAALPLVTHGELFGVLGIRFRHCRRFDASDQSLLLTLSELCAQAFERSRLFAAERKARAESEAANRAKDEFLAMLGHELRNPLAPIVTALSLMKLRDADTSRKERNAIERQVTHLVRLVDDLLDVSRITQGKVELKKEHVELSEIVSRAVELSSPLLEQRKHHLLLSVERDGLPVHGDPTRLAQVVSNLLTNSAKYTPPGGHIDVQARRRGKRIVLTVGDDGAGIATEMLPHVFELFAQERQSLDRSQGGLGLGLAIAKSLVSMHDGSISAFSEGHSKGSVFTVDLPADDPIPASTPLPPLPMMKRAADSGRRVLVVDDNPDAAGLLADVLRAHGYVAAIALDGPGALHLAGSFRPEIALLDIGLPVMDGYELARRLGARRAERCSRLTPASGNMKRWIRDVPVIVSILRLRDERDHAAGRMAPVGGRRPET